MSSCRQLTEIASEYLEKNLSWRRRLGVKVHLWMCRYCRRYLDQMRKVIDLVRGLPIEPVPPELPEKLLSQFREAREKQV